jgi:uncharacterized integral membrane protein
MVIKTAVPASPDVADGTLPAGAGQSTRPRSTWGVVTFILLAGPVVFAAANLAGTLVDTTTGHARLGVGVRVVAAIVLSLIVGFSADAAVRQIRRDWAGLLSLVRR